MNKKRSRKGASLSFLAIFCLSVVSTSAVSPCVSWAEPSLVPKAYLELVQDQIHEHFRDFEQRYEILALRKHCPSVYEEVRQQIEDYKRSNPNASESLILQAGYHYLTNAKSPWYGARDYIQSVEEFQKQAKLFAEKLLEKVEFELNASEQTDSLEEREAKIQAQLKRILEFNSDLERIFAAIESKLEAQGQTYGSELNEDVFRLSGKGKGMCSVESCKRHSLTTCRCDLEFCTQHYRADKHECSETPEKVRAKYKEVLRKKLPKSVDVKVPEI